MTLVVLLATERKAVTVLCEEIEKRTGIQLKQATQWPDSPTPVIALGLQSQVKQFAGPEYAIAVFEPEAEKLLRRIEPTATHYEVRACTVEPA